MITTQQLDAIFEQADGHAESLAKLGVRDILTDPDGERWTVTSYGCTQILKNIFSEVSEKWLETLIELRTSALPNTLAEQAQYRTDLVWLWTAVAFGRPESTNKSLAIRRLKRAMQDPTHGPGRAGWGAPGDGWLADSLVYLKRLAKKSAISAQPTRLVVWILQGTANAKHAFDFEPNSSHVNALSEGLVLHPLHPWAGTPEEFLMPRDFHSGIGCLMIYTLDATLELNTPSLVPDNILDALWENVTSQDADRIADLTLRHLSREFFSLGIGYEEGKSWSLNSNVARFAALGLSALRFAPHALNQSATKHVIEALMSGQVRFNPSKSDAVISKALNYLRPFWRAGKLDNTLPPSLTSSPPPRF